MELEESKVNIPDSANGSLSGVSRVSFLSYFYASAILMQKKQCYQKVFSYFIVFHLYEHEYSQ